MSDSSKLKNLVEKFMTFHCSECSIQNTSKSENKDAACIFVFKIFGKTHEEKKNQIKFLEQLGAIQCKEIQYFKKLDLFLVNEDEKKEFIKKIGNLTGKNFPDDRELPKTLDQKRNKYMDELSDNEKNQLFYNSESDYILYSVEESVFEKKLSQLNDATKSNLKKLYIQCLDEKLEQEIGQMPSDCNIEEGIKTKNKLLKMINEDRANQNKAKETKDKDFDIYDFLYNKTLPLIKYEKSKFILFKYTIALLMTNDCLNESNSYLAKYQKTIADNFSFESASFLSEKASKANN